MGSPAQWRATRYDPGTCASAHMSFLYDPFATTPPLIQCSHTVPMGNPHVKRMTPSQHSQESHPGSFEKSACVWACRSENVRVGRKTQAPHPPAAHPTMPASPVQRPRPQCGAGSKNFLALLCLLAQTKNSHQMHKPSPPSPIGRSKKPFLLPPHSFSTPTALRLNKKVPALDRLLLAVLPTTMVAMRLTVWRAVASILPR